MGKTNNYYYNIIKTGDRKEALNSCNILLKRYRKMQEWGFRFCGDTANIVYLEELKEDLRKETE